jgi:hypothetical protein
MMTKTLARICLAVGLVTISASAFAFDDFSGLIESRPDDGMGVWIIGGRRIYATERTKLDDHDGPLEVGACVEVDIHNGWVTEIERDAEWKCRD